VRAGRAARLLHGHVACVAQQDVAHRALEMRSLVRRVIQGCDHWSWMPVARKRLPTVGRAGDGQVCGRRQTCLGQCLDACVKRMLEGCLRRECAHYDAILFHKFFGNCFFDATTFWSQDLRRNASLSCSALQTVREVSDDVGAIPARHFCRARSCVGTIMWIISRNITP
jgi:hypothetical protein